VSELISVSDEDIDDDNALEDLDPLLVQQDIADVVLAPAGVPDSKQELSCLNDIVDDEDDDEDFVSLPTFKETDKCSMNIVSFLELKKVCLDVFEFY